MSGAPPLLARLLEAVGWALVHSLWQGVLVAAALAVMLYSLPPRRARARYAASYAAVLASAALPAATVPWLLLRPGAHAEPEAAGAAVARLGDLAATLSPFLRWAAVLWALAAGVATARWLGGWVRVRRLARRAPAAPPAWVRRLAVLAERLGVRREVRLATWERLAVPMLVGHRRPTILLPPHLLEALSAGEMANLLAHELAHVVRHDFAANLVQRLCTAFVPFHPFLRVFSRRASEEREHACDDLAATAAGGPLAYARSLAHLEELRAGSPPPAPRTALAAGDGCLLRRIRRLDPRAGGVPGSASGAQSAWAALPLALLAAGCVTLYPTTRALVGAASGGGASVYTVHARDPAGEFTVTVADGRAVAATVAGVPVSPGRLRQADGELAFLDEDGRLLFAVHLEPGGLSWRARSPSDF